ncbi:LysR family transcriptional regulator [Sphingobium sp. Sx8-8]|uniref:LysR family transcriptional regulator n=1 Tax=Sphingobium sp. Sx8-8 TaxID=2933617 RepID=UPI001F592060|nr:LysR family transcriptional regulator [Sphingobium sp. Sx8-8]
MSDLERLVRFAIVAEELSFSKAARRLRVDQPWLSRQIQQLENQLGLQLFVRTTRSVKLTPEGKRLLPQAHELAEVVDRCKQTMRMLRHDHEAELLVGVQPSSFWIPVKNSLFESFSKRYPRANLIISNHYTPRLISKLRSHLIDAAILPEPFDCAEFEYLTIHESRPVLFVPSEHPLASMDSITPDQVAGLKIAVTDPKLNPKIHSTIYAPFTDAGAETHVVSEGSVALPFYARTERLALVSIGYPYSEALPGPDFSVVPLSDAFSPVRYALCRHRETERGLLDHFWNLARQITIEHGIGQPAPQEGLEYDDAAGQVQL